MTTLLVAGQDRCTAACYDATGPDCTCVCDGQLHGIGFERAVAQAPELVDAGRPLVAMLELPLSCGSLPRAQNVGKEPVVHNLEAVHETPAPPEIGTGSPYSHEEWAAVKAALPRERQRRQKAGLPFGQTEQGALVDEVVRALRAAALEAR